MQNGLAPVRLVRPIAIAARPCSAPQVFLRAGVMLLAVLLTAGQARADTWYVRATGHDANGGFTPASALRTISEAEDRVSAGDTVYVGAGTYAEHVEIKKNGTAGAYITFIADTDGAQTGDAGDVIVSGGSSRLGFYFEGDYLRAVGFHVSYAKDEGVKTNGCSFVSIESFTIYYSGKEGIHMHGGSDVTILNCTVHHSGSEGMRVHGDRITVTGCTAYSNGKQGIQVDPGTSGCTVSGCVSYSNTEEGFEIHNKMTIFNCLAYSNVKSGFLLDSVDSGSAFYNCTSVDNQQYGVELKSGTISLLNNIFAWNKELGLKGNDSAASDFNLYWANRESTAEDWSNQIDGCSVGANDFMADPLFVNRAGLDFHLTSSSPAVDAGTSATAPTTDFEGHSRTGDIDIGADEYHNPKPRIISWRQVER
jgi:parallel beta-helix repeat protein